MSNKPEILIYMSDQHSALSRHGCGDDIVCTPFLDSLEKSAYVFDNAYTACPLCVPARTAFMTARLPSRSKVFQNADDYKSSEITFAHLLGISGYRTTLIGRMHFVGEDRLHGFDRHVGRDITAPYWGTGGPQRDDWGEFRKGFAAKTAPGVVGTGDSPVQEFDRHVVSWTAKTLRESNEAEPGLFVVGTYGPHFPYVGNRALMEKYLEAEPETTYPELDVHPAVAFSRFPVSARKKAEITAAYRALVETQDRHIETVYREFEAYLERRNRPGVFIYVSDHGDMCGRRDLYGKKTFYEPSSHIPLYMKITGKKGRHIKSSVSLMDIGPTLAEMTGSPAYPDADGTSFFNLLEEEDSQRYALAEFFDNRDGGFSGHMVHRNGYKYIHYPAFSGDDELYCTRKDPEEEENLVSRDPELAKELKELLAPCIREAGNMISEMRRNRQKAALLRQYGKTRRYKNRETTEILSFKGVSPEPIGTN